MHFIDEFLRGQEGQAVGLYMGDGVGKLCRTIGGVQRHRIYCVASAPKVGKSTLVDYAFLLSPYLDAKKRNQDARFVYLSFEIDRVSKEFDVASFFLAYDHGIREVELPVGVRVDGSDRVGISSAYLRGRLQDDRGNVVKCDPYVRTCLETVYQDRIIPIFGEHNKYGVRIKPGAVEFIESRLTPSGAYHMLIEMARSRGSFTSTNNGMSDTDSAYVPTNPDEYVVVITDHLRKLVIENGTTLKGTIDKYLDYTVRLRNMCNYTFTHVIHTNRDLASMDRMRMFKDRLFPTAELIKDSGNVSEDADYVITLFNPNDDRYQLTSHFGMELRAEDGTQKYPDMRTIHLVESRHCVYPQHFMVNMNGGTKEFTPFNR